jgi:hypothetical protein
MHSARRVIESKRDFSMRTMMWRALYVSPYLLVTGVAAVQAYLEHLCSEDVSSAGLDVGTGYVTNQKPDDLLRQLCSA